MSENSISSDVQGFIARYIQSIEQLEILLCLSQNGERAWSAHDIFRKLQSNEKSISDRLEYFVKEGIVEPQEGGLYRLAPGQPQLTQIVADLARAYRERPVGIIELIYRKPDRIQNFADAFKFRKDK